MKRILWLKQNWIRSGPFDLKIPIVLADAMTPLGFEGSDGLHI